jgi:malonate-semialdehyde dehydrogenase (acetylating)/methylmalonate-semialdehyde dehydrogenase
LERIEGFIGSVDKEGGKIHLDGRGVKVTEYPKGNFVGPTIVEVSTDMSAYKSV